MSSITARSAGSVSETRRPPTFGGSDPGTDERHHAVLFNHLPALVPAKRRRTAPTAEAEAGAS